MGGILFVDQYRQMGGGQRVLLSVIERALETYESATVLLPRGGELEDILASTFGNRVRLVHSRELRLTPGHKTFYDALRLLRYLFYFIRFIPLFRSADTIWVNGGRLYLPCWLLSGFIRRRYVYHVHIDYSAGEKRLLRRILHSPRTHRIVVASGFLRRQLVDFDPAFSSDRVQVVRNALPASFARLPFVDRFRGAEPSGIGLIGRVSEEKGQDVVVALAERFPRVRFYILGDSDFSRRHFLADLEAACGSNVRFLGKVEDVARAIDEHGIRLSLVPSRWQEPFGLVAIESMACSCLTLVRERGELPDIAARTSALTFRTDAELADRIEELLGEDPALLAEKAREQHGRAVEEYAPEGFSQAIGEVLASYKPSVTRGNSKR